MRIKMELISEQKVSLHTGFNVFLQALIYKHLTSDNSEWLHSKGFKFEKRNFKLFCFSSILERGKYLPDRKLFIFPNKISFIISSPVDWILQDLASNFIKAPEIYLGQNLFTVSSIAILKTPALTQSEVKINAISPIEIHSTFEIFHENKKKRKTHYYSPFEPEYSELINRNMQKKWNALYKKECPYNLSLKPLFKGKQNEKIVYFGKGEKKNLIKGWKGYFMLLGEPEFLVFALDAGLGGKNSQGFGMIEICRGD